MTVGLMASFGPLKALASLVFDPWSVGPKALAEVLASLVTMTKGVVFGLGGIGRWSPKMEDLEPEMNVNSEGSTYSEDDFHPPHV